MRIVYLLGACIACFGATIVDQIPSCRCKLLQTFPEDFESKDTEVDILTFVTFRDSNDFVRVLELHGHFSNKNVGDSAKLADDIAFNWCNYLGYDGKYHYAVGVYAPGELYRIQRDRIADDVIINAIAGQLKRVTMSNQRSGVTRQGSTVALPRSKLCLEWQATVSLDSKLFAQATAMSEP